MYNVKCLLLFHFWISMMGWWDYHSRYLLLFIAIYCQGTRNSLSKNWKSFMLPILAFLLTRMHRFALFGTLNLKIFRHAGRRWPPFPHLSRLARYASHLTLKTSELNFLEYPPLPKLIRKQFRLQWWSFSVRRPIILVEWYEINNKE
jgi:hypothetical protein